jgi:hypothetical protein
LPGRWLVFGLALERDYYPDRRLEIREVGTRLGGQRDDPAAREVEPTRVELGKVVDAGEQAEEEYRLQHEVDRADPPVCLE